MNELEKETIRSTTNRGSSFWQVSTLLRLWFRLALVVSILSWGSSDSYARNEENLSNEGLISSPATPNETIPVELVTQLGGTTDAVAVEGNFAYLGVGPRLVILYIADPANPVMVGQTAPMPTDVLGVAVSGGYAYVADFGGGIAIMRGALLPLYLPAMMKNF